MPDLYFYRDPEEAEREEEIDLKDEAPADQWGGDKPMDETWGDKVKFGSVVI